ncbi:hypothetical protein U3516DRAFT_760541 [Neocallimastix sp. 'constans']
MSIFMAIVAVSIGICFFIEIIWKFSHFRDSKYEMNVQFPLYLILFNSSLKNVLNFLFLHSVPIYFVKIELRLSKYSLKLSLSISNLLYFQFDFKESTLCIFVKAVQYYNPDSSTSTGTLFIVVLDVFVFFAIFIAFVKVFEEELLVVLKSENDAHILLCVYSLILLLFSLRKTYSFMNMSLPDIYNHFSIYESNITTTFNVTQ